MFLNILFFYELSELWGGATSISDGILYYGIASLVSSLEYCYSVKRGWAETSLSAERMWLCAVPLKIEFPSEHQNKAKSQTSLIYKIGQYWKAIFIQLNFLQPSCGAVSVEHGKPVL